MSREYKMAEGSIHMEFNQSRNKVQIFGGGFGNGKTAALCIKALQLCKDYPGCNGLLARETYPKLNDTLRKELYLWCPADWVKRWPTKDDNTLILINGSTINFRYVQQRGKQQADGTTTSNLLSATYDWIGVDQIEDPGIQEKDFLDLLGRLRGSTPYRGDSERMPKTGPRWLMATCNPTTGWFYKKVIRPLHRFTKRGVIGDDLYVDAGGKPIIDLIEGSTYENSANLPPDFLEALESAYQGQMRDRFLMGKWAAYEGLVYSGFDEQIHVLPHEAIFEYLRGCKTAYMMPEALMVYDFGQANPSAFIMGFVDDWGRVFWVDGFYKKEYDLTEQGPHIKRIKSEWEGYIDTNKVICADPDLWRRKVVRGFKSTGQTISGIFEDDFHIRMRPSDNTLHTGIAKVTSYLGFHPNLQCPPMIGGERSRMMYFSDKLPWIADEFQNYFWKKNPMGDYEDEPIKRNDHSLDCIRYGLSFRPDPAEIVPPPSATIPEWLKWHEMDVDGHDARW